MAVDVPQPPPPTAPTAPTAARTPPGTPPGTTEPSGAAGAADASAVPPASPFIRIPISRFHGTPSQKTNSPAERSFDKADDTLPNRPSTPKSSYVSAFPRTSPGGSEDGFTPLSPSAQPPRLILSPKTPKTPARDLLQSPGRSPQTVQGTGGSNRVQEMSQALRARLSYAVLKVQRGWSGNSIDELEAAAPLRQKRSLGNLGISGGRSLEALGLNNHTENRHIRTNSDSKVRNYDLFWKSRPTVQASNSQATATASSGLGSSFKMKSSMPNTQPLSFTSSRHVPSPAFEPTSPNSSFMITKSPRANRRALPHLSLSPRRPEHPAISIDTTIRSQSVERDQSEAEAVETLIALSSPRRPEPTASLGGSSARKDSESNGNGAIEASSPGNGGFKPRLLFQPAVGVRETRGSEDVIDDASSGDTMILNDSDDNDNVN